MMLKFLKSRRGAAHPGRQLEPPETLVAPQRRLDVPLDHRRQHSVLGGVTLGDQLGGQLFGKGFFPEALQAGAEAQGHELPPLGGFQLPFREQQRDHRKQCGLDGVVVHLAHPVVVFLHHLLGLFVQVGRAPVQRLPGLGAVRPGPKAVQCFRLVRRQEQREPQLEHPLCKDQRLFRHLVQQGLPKARPVKFRVQGAAQPVVKISDPVEGRGHLGQADVHGTGHLLQHPADLDLHANHLSIFVRWFCWQMLPSAFALSRF